MPRTNLVIGANRGIGLGLVEELVSGRRSYLFERMRKHLPSQVKKHSTDVVYATARVPAEAKELQEIARKSDGRVIVVQLDMVDQASIDVSDSPRSAAGSIAANGGDRLPPPRLPSPQRHSTR
jgi:NAD(P)-dependent dehydrogenase (short-subunit alcohol dehydrogenase family)